MTSIEQTGKNIEEATQLALQKLGVTEDEVDVEILEEGSRGFLGLKQTPARVRVTVKKSPAVRVEAEEKPKSRSRSRSRSKPKPKQEKKQEMTAEPPKPTPEIPVQEQPTVMTEDKLREAAEIGREVLQRILDGVGEGGTVSVKNVSSGQVSLEIQGGDASILIGKHGQTIDAMQYLTGIITNRRIGDRVRLVVDVEKYRTKREEALKNQAVYLADQVRQSGQEAVLEPLPAAERRIVHTTLVDDPDVYTYSEGEEPERYVVISPRK